MDRHQSDLQVVQIVDFEAQVAELGERLEADSPCLSLKELFRAHYIQSQRLELAHCKHQVLLVWLVDLLLVVVAAIRQAVDSADIAAIVASSHYCFAEQVLEAMLA